MLRTVIFVFPIFISVTFYNTRYKCIPYGIRTIAKSLCKERVGICYHHYHRAVPRIYGCFYSDQEFRSITLSAIYPHLLLPHSLHERQPSSKTRLLLPHSVQVALDTIFFSSVYFFNVRAMALLKLVISP